jgi:hypothetical protein
VDLERLVAAPEGVDIDIGRPGHELKDALSASSAAMSASAGRRTDAILQKFWTLDRTDDVRGLLDGLSLQT